MHDGGEEYNGTRRSEEDTQASPDQNEVPALAIGALDSTEELVILDGLRSSLAARRELLEIEEIVGDLGYAVQPARPPGRLRERVLNATRPRDPVAIEDVRVTRLSPSVWIGSLAAVALILALGVVAFSQWSAAQDRGERIDELEAEITFQDQRIAELETAARSAGAFIDFEQPMVWTQLSTTSPNEESPGFLARTPDGQTAYLVLTGIEVDANHVFQAWLIDDTPVPAGTLRPSESGMGFLILQHPDQPVHGYSLIGVTIEPPGGSPQPTSDPIIIAEIA
ncbi:hypothetical protein BH23CHL2_BH23CHL2_08190 [soil metagenome]